MNHVITVEKLFERRSNLEKIKKQVNKLKERALTAGRADRGWNCELLFRTPEHKDTGTIYSYDMEFVYTGKKTVDENKELQNICKIIQVAGNATRWKVIQVDGEPYEEQAMVSDDGQDIMPYAMCEIPRGWHTFFEEIYEREDQIDIVISRIQAAIDSEWTNRFHCALVGEPAGGKTEVARAMKRMLGTEAVLELDVPSTTQAGVIKNLSQRAELPRVIIGEEAEKGSWKDLGWLLAAMDPRAEVRKLNFRSKILFEMKCLFILTINNYKLFKGVLEGALASRCGDPIFFPKPSEEVLRMILKREVTKISGNQAWVEPVVEFCRELKVTDPRTALSWCLSGKDGLLGRAPYLKKLRHTRMPEI